MGRLMHPRVRNFALTYLEAAGVLEDGVFDAERVHLPRSVLLRLRPDCEPEDEQGGGLNTYSFSTFLNHSLNFVLLPQLFRLIVWNKHYQYENILSVTKSVEFGPSSMKFAHPRGKKASGHSPAHCPPPSPVVSSFVHSHSSI